MALYSVRDIIKQGYGEKKFQHLEGIRDNSLSTKNNQVYYDKQNNKVIQNIKGTNPLSPQDIYTDLVLGIGGARALRKTDRFKESEKILAKAKEKYPNSQVSVVGHSLGSSIGRLAADKKQDKFVGVNGFYTQSRGISNNDGRFRDYRNIFDPVSLLGVGKKNVKTLTYNTKFPSVKGLLQNHSSNSIPKNIYV
jgi:hypothetical protein